VNASRIVYRFKVPKQPEHVFELQLDADTSTIVDALPDDLPYWTKLEFNQCSGCPLNAAESPHCPAAVRLASIGSSFANLVSFDQVEVAVETAERTISAHTSAQTALASLIGLIMASSNCPRTAVFRPMARFHLPFSSESETAYRVASMYLLAQHYAERDGREPDLELKDLALVYRGVHLVNRGMVQRLRAATREDAVVNAIVLLDVYTSLVPAAIDELLKELRPSFVPLLNAPLRNNERNE
jgi:hypothetical protein